MVSMMAMSLGIPKAGFLDRDVDCVRFERRGDRRSGTALQGGRARKLDRVVSHDLTRLLFANPGEPVGVADRLRDALEVGPIRSQERPVGTNPGGDFDGIVFPEGSHPDVSLEDIDWLLVEHCRELIAGDRELMDQAIDPVCAVFDRSDAQAGMTLKELFADHRSKRVVDIAVCPVNDRAERRSKERLHIPGSSPDLLEITIGRGAAMDHRRYARFIDARPEWIEVGRERRAHPGFGGDRTRLDQDHPRAPPEDPLELTNGMGDIA